MHYSGSFASILLFLMCIISTYRGKSDDSIGASLSEYDVDTEMHHWISEENKAFAESGVCTAENLTRVEICSSRGIVRNLHALMRSHCFCDWDCHKYGDCCLNLFEVRRSKNPSWKCRRIKTGPEFSAPIYVWQKCSGEWSDEHIQTMCEKEASELYEIRQAYSYLQDIPVKSKTSGIFYRNVFCALCNHENNLVEWDSTIYCPNLSVEDYGLDAGGLDLSQSVYDPRSQRFKHVMFEGVKANCNLVVHDFSVKKLVNFHQARLCKSVIDSCDSYADKIARQKCQSYSSFVYEGKSKVYKNFHCALCNSANVGKLRCTDPAFPPLYSPPVNFSAVVSLNFLFDFNFGGGNNQVGNTNPCKLKDGLVWDHVRKKCTNFSCGILYERKGDKCVPRVNVNETGGINSSCPRIILLKDSFDVNKNGSIFIKQTGQLLTLNDYEINEKVGNQINSISICAEEGSYLLHLSIVNYWLTEITLSLSIICLVLHLMVYSVLKDLRNSPGKILMSLSSCLICGHFSLLTGQYLMDYYWMCYLSSALTHFGYLSSFLWMNVMAYDIYRTFSMTKSRNMKNKSTFIKYSCYSWTIAVSLTTFSLVFDNTVSIENVFRPKYGYPLCWFNQRKGLIIFFILPISILIAKNITFFIITAFRIRRISKDTKMIKNFSDKERFLLYIKLTVVFGLTWLFGILAGLLRISFLWYPFIILNGLQGVFIFLSFTVKRKILKMLLVKFKIHSDSYKMGKQSAIKRAIYSSLSNLSTLQTTVTSQLPNLKESKGILKAVRKINPDSAIEEKVI